MASRDEPRNPTPRRKLSRYRSEGGYTLLELATALSLFALLAAAFLLLTLSILHQEGVALANQKTAYRLDLLRQAWTNAVWAAAPDGIQFRDGPREVPCRTGQSITAPSLSLTIPLDGAPPVDLPPGIPPVASGRKEIVVFSATETGKALLYSPAGWSTVPAPVAGALPLERIEATVFIDGEPYPPIDYGILAAPANGYPWQSVCTVPGDPTSVVLEAYGAATVEGIPRVEEVSTWAEPLRFGSP